MGHSVPSILSEMGLKGAKNMDLPANQKFMKYIGGAGTYYPQVNADGIDAKDFVPAMSSAIKTANAPDQQLLNKMLQVLSAWDGRSVIDVVNDDHCWRPRLF